MNSNKTVAIYSKGISQNKTVIIKTFHYFLKYKTFFSKEEIKRAAIPETLHKQVLQARRTEESRTAQVGLGVGVTFREGCCH